MKAELENKKRLDNLEKRIIEYNYDYKLLGQEKDEVEQRIINLQTRITNLENNED